MAQVDFPYGKKRNWELDTADVDIGLKSVAERCGLSPPSHPFALFMCVAAV
jgi:hypothetical protein